MLVEANTNQNQKFWSRFFLRKREYKLYGGKLSDFAYLPSEKKFWSSSDPHNQIFTFQIWNFQNVWLKIKTELFFWRKIYKIWQFLTIQFVHTFTQKKNWDVFSSSDWCLLRPKMLTQPKFQNRPKSRFENDEIIEKNLPTSQKICFLLFSS